MLRQIGGSCLFPRDVAAPAAQLPAGLSEVQGGQTTFLWAHRLEENLHLDATMNTMFQQPRH